MYKRRTIDQELTLHQNVQTLYHQFVKWQQSQGPWEGSSKAAKVRGSVDWNALMKAPFTRMLLSGIQFNEEGTLLPTFHLAPSVRQEWIEGGRTNDAIDDFLPTLQRTWKWAVEDADAMVCEGGTTPLWGVVKVSEDATRMLLQGGSGPTLSILRPIYKRLYTLHPSNEAMYALLLRYDWLLGDAPGFQQAFPLRSALQPTITFEGFASPFNVEAGNGYCSACPDTDRPYGSLGSWFSFPFTQWPTKQELNPPFTEDFLDRMGERIVEGFAARGDTPTTVVVIAPNWTNCRGLDCLRALPFTHEGRMMPGTHSYLPGNHYRHGNTSQVARIETCVLVVTNEGDVVASELIETITSTWGNHHR